MAEMLEQVEEDEAYLSGDVQAALLEEVRLPCEGLDGADQGHEGAKNEDDLGVQVISQDCVRHTEVVRVPSSGDKIVKP